MRGTSVGEIDEEGSRLCGRVQDDTEPPGFSPQMPGWSLNSSRKGQNSTESEPKKEIPFNGIKPPIQSSSICGDKNQLP